MSHSNPNVRDYAGKSYNKQTAPQQPPSQNSLVGGTTIANIQSGYTRPSPPLKYPNTAVHKVKMQYLAGLGNTISFDNFISINASDISCVRKDPGHPPSIRFFLKHTQIPNGYLGVLAKDQPDVDNLYDRIMYVLTHGGEA